MAFFSQKSERNHFLVLQLKIFFQIRHLLGVFLIPDVRVIAVLVRPGAVILNIVRGTAWIPPQA